MADEAPTSEIIVGNAGVCDWQIGLSQIVNETYNYANSSLFLGVMPAYYRDYAWRYLRPAIQWLDGYVPALHQQGFSGIMSTRIATKLITGLTKQVVGEKLVFKPNDKSFDESTKKALQFISAWYDRNNIIKSVYGSIGFSLGLGTSLLKMNVSEFNEIWWEAVRFDNCFYFADFKNDIKECTCLIRGYTDTRKEHSNDQFYLVEHRYYHTIKIKDKYFKLIEMVDDKPMVVHKVGDKVPMVEYQVYKVLGTTQNNVMPSISKSGSIPWEQIPYDVREMIKQNYSTLRIDEPKPLPFRDLGVQALLNGEIDLAIPTASNFGESMIVGIQDDLITYEVACSYLLRDMYLGKGTVYLPKSQSLSDLTGTPGFRPNNVLNGVGDTKIELLKGVDPESQKAIVQQFEIRADQWQVVKENALKSIAVKWGMSPKILASFLAGSGQQQTATQVDSEDDLSIAFIYHTRAYFKNALNKLLEETLNFYGIANNIKIDFASPSLLNKDRLIDRVSRELDAGLIDIEDAIRTIYPDLDEEALQDKIEKAKVVQHEKQQSQFNEMNFDGTFGNEQYEEPKDVEGTTYPTN